MPEGIAFYQKIILNRDEIKYAEKSFLTHVKIIGYEVMFSMLDIQANNLSEFIPDWTLYIWTCTTYSAKIYLSNKKIYSRCFQ